MERGTADAPGQIVILNGAPRSGKTSIAAAMQATLTGVWMNLGVDVARQMTPASLQPGVGLRPGEPDHRAAGAVPILYAALYESIAAHARLGLNVAVDVGHHERTNLVDAARRVAGLSVLFVGVRCPVEVIRERRRGSEPGRYATAIEAAVRWERAVHRWRYDLELDTARLAPEECAAAIGERLRAPNAPSAFAQFS